MEYKVAQKIQPILKERMGIEIEDDEIGYVALHVHTAINDEKISQAMQMAQAVRECISLVEKEVGKPIDIMSHISIFASAFCNKNKLYCLTIINFKEMITFDHLAVCHGFHKTGNIPEIFFFYWKSR